MHLQPGRLAGISKRDWKMRIIDVKKAFVFMSGMALGQITAILLAPDLDIFAYAGIPAPLALPLSGILWVLSMGLMIMAMQKFCTFKEGYA